MLHPIRIASLLLIALLASASHLSACDFCGGPNAVRSAPGGGAWSSPSTWAAGAVPLAGSQVLIEPGSTVVLDVVTPALKSLVVEGVLRAAADRDVGMTADYIIAMGAGAVLEVGSATAPYTRRCVITLTGSDRAANVSGVAPLNTGSKVLMSMDGGRIDLHGASRAKTPWTTLGATAAAGATTITLAAAPAYWAVGDQLCIAPTGFDPLQAERVTITAISGATVTITPALRHAHWGVLQTIAGVEVDERAEVGNLSRNILVQGDPASDAEGFGMHGMVMPGGQAFIEGVEFQRAGQAGLKARYPFHWHLVDRLAKDGVTGAGQYIRNCSFNSSFQRAVVIHGTNGVLVEGNVAYDVRNHCYVPSEDGDEVGNIFRGNLGMLIRRPLDGRFAFDTPNGSTQNEGSSSVFWLRNPDQAISGNHAAGAQDGSSYFFDRADSPAFEAVANRLNRPIFFEGNVGHSNSKAFGHFGAHQYHTSQGMGVFTNNAENGVRFSGPGFLAFRGNRFWKMMGGGFWLENEEYVTGNLMVDCASGLHTEDAYVHANTFIGRSGNLHGELNGSGGYVRNASGLDSSFTNRFMRVRLVDNRFIGMDDAVAQIVDITTLASFKTFGNQIEGQTGPRFSRNEVNINGMNGAVLDVDGSLFGEGVPSIFTTGRQNPASVDRPDMNGFITRVADITGWGWGFFAPGLDGATLPADAVRLAVRSVSLPADEIRRRGFVTIGERSWPLTLSQAGEVTVTLDGLAPGWHMAFLHGDQNTNWMWTNWGPRMDILVFQVSGSAPQNQAPVVALTAPANGATAVTPATIALAADASDPDGSIASVAFFVGGTQISSDSSAPYTASWSPTAAGTYQLTARATDNLGAVTVSAARSVTVSLGSGLPSGYTAQDIGAVAAAGSTSESGGTWTLKGSGADIWNNADEFQFAWRQVTGDVQITARVASLQNTHQWAKAGVMIRESLAPGSRHASTFVTPGNGTCHQRRSVTDGSSGHTAGPKGAAPMWVRIERVGTMLISSSSADGTTWTQIRRQTLAMGAPVYVGLAVTSHKDGTLATATFTNLQIVTAAAAAN